MACKALSATLNTCNGLQRIRVEELTQHPWLLGQQLEPASPVEPSFQTESDIHSIVERARQRRLQQRNSHKLRSIPSGQTSGIDHLAMEE